MAENGLRFEQVRAEWLALPSNRPVDFDRFADVKREADTLIEAGKWVSGPSDLLSILGRGRDELAHSRLIAWLLVPTNQHGLGRGVLTSLADLLWPGEQLFRSGPVFVETEVTARAFDADGRSREARADIVVHGDGLRVVIENKVDAGEGPDQCERLYWAWAAEPGETRWVFLTPTGRAPLSAISIDARSVWRTLSYARLREVVASAFEDPAAATPTSTGRQAAAQYLASLMALV